MQHSLPFGLEHLFSGERSIQIGYRGYQKRGHLFAILPNGSQLATLLPAQSVLAKAHRLFVRTLSPLGLGKLLGEDIFIPFSPCNPLTSYLERTTGSSLRSANAPVFLPGNPSGPSPRLIIICRNAAGFPAVAVKLGSTISARQLIRKEFQFLDDNSNKAKNFIPTPLELFETPEVTAFSIPFIEGTTPGGDIHSSHLQLHLGKWVDTSTSLPLRKIPSYRDFFSTLSSAETGRVAELIALLDFSVHPVLFHGDFAPWNIKVQPDGSWMALDWERGEPMGVPGWDWFHFRIQSRILINHWNANRIWKSLPALIADSDFMNYAARTGITRITAELLRGYLIYADRMLQPTERTNVYSELARMAIYEAL